MQNRSAVNIQLKKLLSAKQFEQILTKKQLQISGNYVNGKIAFMSSGQ